MQGFTTFRLEFHLAHPILREVKGTPPVITTSHIVDGSRTAIADLSFLTPRASSGSTVQYMIYQAHISVVICGWSNTQWTGYAFTKTGLQDEAAQEYDEGEPNPDLFAADRDDDYVKDADYPTWDARTYWLQIVAIRCQLILKEWTYLVHTIEERVHALVSHKFHLSGLS
jgi:hypothetical protein